jgi:CRISPR system Cascade subunit CasA
MPTNLLDNPWIPVRRRDGTPDMICPWQIAERTNPVVAVAAPRADFNGALWQFLIGLLQTAFAPDDEEDWFERHEDPPSPETLRAAFDRYRDAFYLDGEGPCFMQDRDPLEGQKPLPITALLIDTAGSSTHFVKDLSPEGFSPAMAALTLFALQTNAPSGGVGHRTSVRGGGPLTTLIVCTPDETSPRQPTLWDSLWLNVLEASRFPGARKNPEDIFPWLGPTRVSDKTGVTTTPQDVSPLQMFWGMPRRIRLRLEEADDGTCGLSGTATNLRVREYRTRNYGTNYPAETWHHTLSPHNRDAKQALPAHPRGSISYRHWLGLAQRAGDKKTQRIPADVVDAFYHRKLHHEGLRFRLWAFGYDLDNMKPRCWYEATLPLFRLETAEARQAVESAVDVMVNAAWEFLGNLRGCLKDAWFAKNDPRRSGADTAFVESAFWAETESTFYDYLTDLAAHVGDAERRKGRLHQWHTDLLRYTEQSFDRWVNAKLIGDQTHPRRIAEARRNLRRFNYKARIKNLLDLPTKDQATA